MDGFQIAVASDGHMVLPDELRQQLRVEHGGLVTIRAEAGQIVIEGVEDRVARAQAIVRQYVPDPRGIVDEFIAERRAEAARE